MIKFEKIICNIVANPNIRYLIVGGPESEGHLTGEALKALIQNGVDEKARILGTDSPHPFLYNLPTEFKREPETPLLLASAQTLSTMAKLNNYSILLDEISEMPTHISP